VSPPDTAVDPLTGHELKGALPVAYASKHSTDRYTSVLLPTPANRKEIKA
jgi:hypothetical protein